jgi:hypothetical protein
MWLSHQGQVLGGAKRWAALKPEQDGFLIKLEEQATVVMYDSPHLLQ